MKRRILIALSIITFSSCKENSKQEESQNLPSIASVFDDYYEDGEILDPATGKVYSCWIQLESADKLKVRGFLGFSMLGRTQYWYRVK